MKPAIESALREALERLFDAAEVFSARQDRATDPRVGRVQPVSVADCDELNAALAEAQLVLIFSQIEGWPKSCSPGEGRLDTDTDTVRS